MVLLLYGEVFWVVYSKLSKTSKIELFCNISKGYQEFKIFAKSTILKVWLGCEYFSEL